MDDQTYPSVIILRGQVDHLPNCGCFACDETHKAYKVGLYRIIDPTSPVTEDNLEYMWYNEGPTADSALLVAWQDAMSYGYDVTNYTYEDLREKVYGRPYHEQIGKRKRGK